MPIPGTSAMARVNGGTLTVDLFTPDCELHELELPGFAAQAIEEGINDGDLVYVRFLSPSSIAVAPWDAEKAVGQ